MRKEDIKYIKHITPSLDEPDWRNLLSNHFILGLKLLDEAKTDSRFYHSVIFHMNSIIEGMTKLLLRKQGLSEKGTLGKVISNLEKKNVINHQIANRLRSYTAKIRNPSTHDVFNNVKQSDAELAISETFYFMILFKSIFDMDSNHELKTDQLEEIIIRGFCQTFDLYTRYFRKFGKSEKGYIYPVDLEQLTTHIVDFYRNSVFSNFFTVHSKLRSKLGFHLTIDFSSPSETGGVWIIRPNKITDFKFISQTDKNFRIYEEYNRFLRNCKNVYFIVFNFGTRKAAREFILEIKSSNMPYVIINALDRPIKKNSGLYRFFKGK